MWKILFADFQMRISLKQRWGIVVGARGGILSVSESADLLGFSLLHCHLLAIKTVVFRGDYSECCVDINALLMLECGGELIHWSIPLWPQCACVLLATSSRIISHVTEFKSSHTGFFSLTSSVYPRGYGSHQISI